MDGFKNSRQKYTTATYCKMVEFYYDKYMQAMEYSEIKNPANVVMILYFCLSSCFEGIGSKARYPSGDEHFLNIDLLSNADNKDCYKLLLIMVKDFIDKTPDLMDVINKQLPEYFKAHGR